MQQPRRFCFQTRTFRTQTNPSMEKGFKGLSLHVGINKYDREYYGGNIDLNQCVFAAERLHDFAVERDYQANLLTNSNATVAGFRAFVLNAAKTLKKGDFFFLTNSSHGTYDDNIVNGQTKRMTAICLHDGIFLDYEFRELLKKFKSGVTVIWLSDCCFAESNWRFMRGDDQRPYNGARARFVRAPQAAKEAKVTATQGDKRSIKAKVFTYSSSNIYQVSYEDDRGGVFTTSVLDALAKEPNLSYYQLWRRTSEIIAPLYPQSPVFENVRASHLTGNLFLA